MARRPLAPARFLALSFGALISAGTLLLWLPPSSSTGRSVALVDALFTATSAVCVTGLIVLDTPNALSTFGQVVLLLLIQAGGLGYMTISTALAGAVGRRMSFQDRLLLQESLNIDTREGIVRFTRVVAKTTLIIEGVGALLLLAWWTPTHGFWHSAYLGIFHAVSAFNNAGFALFPDNLMRFRGDVLVNLVVTSLIILGGLGFVVLEELRTWVREGSGIRSYNRLSVHVRLVLALTFFLIAGGTLAIFAIERWNPNTLANLSPGEAFLAAYFQAVSPRTAGFNTIDIGAMATPSLFLILVLMFIGASPGGTGGGVKTTTFGVTVAALWATVRGEPDPVVFKRRFTGDVVARAFFICLIAFLALNAVTGLLLLIEGRDLLRTLFETTSAFGTVGLSMGHPGDVRSLVAQFSPAGKLLLALMMFMGRVGPLTLATAVIGRSRRSRLRYPEASISIG